MVLGRFKDAVSDVAETIRRTFQDPPCRTVPTRLICPATTSFQLLEATSHPVPYRFHPGVAVQDLLRKPALQGVLMSFEARICREEAWGAWAAGARVCEMPVFRVGNCSRLAVPPLPRTAPVHSASLPTFRVTSRFIREVFAPPTVRGYSPRLVPPKVHRALEAVLGLPIALAGEDFQKLPRALNMRYTFQLVKANGENIRNLEVLGVFPVPVKGVTSLSHDAKTGRILLKLGPEAIGVPRGRFLLARKKDDRSFVSCFVEE
jgi:hypothetical protein